MEHEIKMEMISEIADAVLRYTNPRLTIDEEESKNNWRYTEEAQDIFNNLYDMIEEVVEPYVKEESTGTYQLPDNDPRQDWHN